ncbi:hypothetical protein [Massilicoli timonensis]|uniref:hypothetical protein n=1 Tax=Massilicoli timonensis TaxID=2015901 RepID=UPI0011AF51DA|nr:hypothetical protein [Massilicoli timonensis]
MQLCNQNKTLNLKDSHRMRKQHTTDSYDTVGDVSMRSDKPKSVVSNTNGKHTYEVHFINGTVDMKELLKELIACRMDKKYEH